MGTGRESIESFFSLTQFPFGLLLAAVFGLTPIEMMKRLTDLTEAYKADLRSSDLPNLTTHGPRAAPSESGGSKEGRGEEAIASASATKSESAESVSRNFETVSVATRRRVGRLARLQQHYPSRWGLGFLSATACAVGIGPAAGLLVHLQVLPVLIGVFTVLAVALLVLSPALMRVDEEPVVSERPGFLEYLLAGLGAAYLPATGGVIGLLVYGLVYGLGTLVTWPSDGSVPQTTFDAGTIAIAAAVLTALVWLVRSYHSNILLLREQLYPKRAGLHSPFFTMATYRRRSVIFRLLLVLLAPVAVGTMIYMTMLTLPSWFFIALQFYVHVLSRRLHLRGEAQGPRDEDAVDAIRKLLTVVGFQTTRTPTTRDSETDPLLVGLDLFAHNEDRALAIAVRTAWYTDAPIDWVTAAGIRVAALTVTDVSQRLGVNIHVAEPWIIFVGGELTEDLKGFAREEGIRISEIEDPQVIERILSDDDPERLTLIAREYLRLEDDGEVRGPGSTSMSIQGMP
jgi:hypothetical protein